MYTILVWNDLRHLMESPKRCLLWSVGKRLLVSLSKKSNLRKNMENSCSLPSNIAVFFSFRNPFTKQDLFNWHVGLLNNISWNLWGAGAFHAGLQIYGKEYAFGGPPEATTEVRRCFFFFPRASERRVFQKEGGVNRSTYKRSSHM